MQNLTLKEQKHLFIITALPLKEQQGAATARINEYTQLLTSNAEVTAYLLSTVYPCNIKQAKVRVRENVFICGEAIGDKSKTFMERNLGRFTNVSGFRKFCQDVIDFIAHFKGQKAVLVYPAIDNYLNESILLNQLKKYNIPVFSERNEINLGRGLNIAFPNHFFKKILFAFSYPFLLLDYYLQDSIAHRYNGNIVISTAFEKRIAKRNKNLIRIPILADAEKYFVVDSGRSHNKGIINLGYTGSISIKKDGLGEMVKAVKILVNDYGIQNIHLNLYGAGYRDTIKKLNKLIKKFNVGRHITMHGSVKSELIPEVLSHQDILVLARPRNLQTKYGFSTKLAEYMASSVPVLTTKVSDHEIYLKDKENAFLLDNHKAETIAKKLNEIIINKDYLNQEIRENAYKTAIEHFSGRKYATELIEFLFIRQTDRKSGN